MQPEQPDDAEADDENGDVFCIGSCKVIKKLRMEDHAKSIAEGDEVIIGLATKHKRTPEESCAICYYDSEAASEYR